MDKQRAAIIKAANELTRKAMDEGRVIEVGWLALRLAVVPPDASAVQLRMMRMAYYGGAQHLFASIMGSDGMDAGEEPTEGDMDRMDKIRKELDAFVAELKSHTSKGAH